MSYQKDELQEVADQDLFVIVDSDENTTKKIQAGNLNIKDGDTLPIGAVVEYNGTTVPQGYEKVSDNNILDSSDIVNNLTSDDTTKILSAAMGKELRNLINLDRLTNVDLSTIKYHCLCGVDNSCTSWIGGYGMLICIPLSRGSNYAIQVGFNDTTVKWRSSINNGTYGDWKTFS